MEAEYFLRICYVIFGYLSEVDFSLKKIMTVAGQQGLISTPALLQSSLTQNQ